MSSDKTEYGPVLNYKDYDKVDANKNYMVSDSYYVICEHPDLCYMKKGEDLRLDRDRTGAMTYLVGNEDYQFIREVIEEKKLKWRPYKDTVEMVRNFEDRFQLYHASHEMPLIWVRRQSDPEYRTIVSTFGLDCVGIEGRFMSLEDLFRIYTYLEGSPCGIME